MPLLDPAVIMVGSCRLAASGSLKIFTSRGREGTDMLDIQPLPYAVRRTDFTASLICGCRIRMRMHQMKMFDELTDILPIPYPISCAWRRRRSRLGCSRFRTLRSHASACSVDEPYSNELTLPALILLSKMSKRHSPC